MGDQLVVTADIFADGHDLLDAALLLRADDEDAWREAPMRPIDNDRWSGHVELTRNRWHRYAIEAWRDAFGSWLHGLHKKVEAAVPVPDGARGGPDPGGGRARSRRDAPRLPMTFASCVRHSLR